MGLIQRIPSHGTLRLELADGGTVDIENIGGRTSHLMLSAPANVIIHRNQRTGTGARTRLSSPIGGTTDVSRTDNDI